MDDLTGLFTIIPSHESYSRTLRFSLYVDIFYYESSGRPMTYTRHNLVVFFSQELSMPVVRSGNIMGLE